MKKIPQRTCMGCNTKKDKKELIRIVKKQDGKIQLDKTGKIAGRGAYICDNVQCLEKVIKSKRLDKIFQCKIEDEVYQNLRGVMIDR